MTVQASFSDALSEGGTALCLAWKTQSILAFTVIAPISMVGWAIPTILPKAPARYTGNRVKA
jgi:hypothetical protein